MRASTLLSAALLLLISPALAAPVDVEVDKRGGLDASMTNPPAPYVPPPASPPCTGTKERRSWFPFWRRQTITGAYDCSFTLAQGETYRFPANSPHGGV